MVDLKDDEPFSMGWWRETVPRETRRSATPDLYPDDAVAPLFYTLCLSKRRGVSQDFSDDGVIP
jgi:hypothetical protein